MEAHEAIRQQAIDDQIKAWQRQDTKEHRWLVLGWVAIIAFAVVAALALTSAIEREVTQRDARSGASNEIAALNGKVDQLVGQVRTADEQIAQQNTDIAALTEQVRQLGGKPVVTTTVVNPAPAAGSSTTAAPKTSTTTPAPTTTTTQPQSPAAQHCVLGVCVNK